MSLFNEKKVIRPNEREAEPVITPEIDMSIPWLDEEKQTKQAQGPGLFQETKPITKKIWLVIDADSLIYKACHVGSRDWVEPDEAPAKNHGLFKEQAPTMLSSQIDIFNAIVGGIQHDVADRLKIKGIGIERTVLLFTPRTEQQRKLGLAPNFRYQLIHDYNAEEQSLYDEINKDRAPEDRFVFKPHTHYKAKRKGAPTPPNVTEVMDYALGRDEAIAADGCEADDLAYALKTDAPEDVLLAVIDKDILHGTPSGKLGHFNFNTKEMVYTSEEEADLFYYRQAIMGDSSDGIPGMRGCGIVTAEETLPSWVSHEDAWSRVMSLADKKGYTEQYMILQMRLVYLGQLNEDSEIQLWLPPEL